ncbi:MAG: transporter [Prevotella sp.]|nr:transporter [Prevotella sp.]
MKTKAFLASLLLAAATTATAGGILTNTNQSIDFLRNPARDAAIGLDGVYSNPAGVAFLPDGFHLGINWQYAHQTRTITSTDNLFALRKNSNGTTRQYEGVADAPVIPSIQLAWNRNNWSMQFNFSVPGGGGKCTYEDGLGSFERAVGTIASGFMDLDRLAEGLNLASPLIYRYAGLPVPTNAINTNGTEGYNMKSYMEGRQYYYGFQLGTAYKINEKMSVYGGLRLLYGNATYKARISNIQVVTAGGDLDFGSMLQHVAVQRQQLAERAGEVMPILNNVPEAAMTPELAALKAGMESLSDPTAQKMMAELPKYSQGVNLLCNQTGVGVAPVVGFDYQLNEHLNFAAKYEFKTQVRMKNESTVFEAGLIDAVNKYVDEENVNEDQPALLTVGAQWTPITPLRVNLGWHYYFDKQAEWYGNTQDKLDFNTNEFLAGAEWDVNDKLTVSLGGQLTRYGLTDQYMSDISFVVNSYSIGFGANYKLNNTVTLKAAFFQTEYGHYKRTTPTQDDFTRTNRVLGIGCDIHL